MPGMTFLGWLAAAYVGTLTIPAQTLDDFNTRFANKVDSGHSCWDRVGGAEGTYSKPGDYSLDLACNYRLKRSVTTGEVVRWELVR